MEQLFVVFVLADGGIDLETFVLFSFNEARSILFQVSFDPLCLLMIVYVLRFSSVQFTIAWKWKAQIHHSLQLMYEILAGRARSGRCRGGLWI